MESSWVRVIAASVSRAVLTVTGGLLLWATFPAAVGWHPAVIMSGSMLPAIVAGDVIVDKKVPVDQLKPGQVVVVADPDHPGRLRTHRLVRVDREGQLILRGDANPMPDSSRIAPEHVVGVAALRVPLVGRPVIWLNERRIVPLVVLGAAAVAAGWATGLDRRRRPRTARLLGRRRGAAAGAAVLAAGAMAATTGTADAALSSQTAGPGNSLAAASSFYPYRDAVLADAPRLYWRLAETTGATAADTSPNNRTGTYYNAYTRDQPSPLASEVRDRSTRFVTGLVTADAPYSATAAFSIEAWFHTTTTAGGRIIGFGNGDLNWASKTVDRQLYMSPQGKVVFGMGSKKRTISSSLSYNDGGWHHVVGTYSSTTGADLYVDGKLVASGTGAAANLTTGYWRIGAEAPLGWPSAPSGNYFAGAIDEAAVYASSLTATRVQVHFAAASS